MEILLNVEAEARDALGDRASKWMVKPSKLLDGMAPAELATSHEGAQVVLIELERASKPLRVVLRMKGP